MPVRLKQWYLSSSRCLRRLGGLALPLFATHHAAVADTIGDALAERDRLKPLQEKTPGPPPASPSSFNPDPGDPFAFPLTLFTDASGEWRSEATLSLGSAPAPPGDFNPDPATTTAIPTPAAETYRLDLRRGDSHAPQTPTQFNPDPGAHLKPPPPPRYYPYRFELTDPQVASPLPSELRLPREAVRHLELVPVPEAKGNPGGTLPPYAGSPKRLNQLIPFSASTHVSYGLDPLPAEQSLPRNGTIRNLPAPTHFGSHGLHRDHHATLPPHTASKNDRYRVGFMPWRRYTGGRLEEQPFGYPDPELWHWYRQSRLKGDLPIIGQDIFLNLTAFSQTLFEARRVPTPSMISAAVPGQSEFFGRGEQMAVNQNLGFSMSLFRGEALAFKPLEWEIKLTPIYNINYVETRETGLVSPDPRGVLGGGPGNNLIPVGNGGVVNPGDIDALLNGQLFTLADLTGTRSTTRTREYLALQEAFLELHLGDLSDNYDFFAFRGGNQHFTSDFRGFLFNDINTGFRVFGNYWNNRLQYNAALFLMREKDTNSELNSFNNRHQQVVVANLYWQDFLTKGYTALFSFHANHDNEDLFYDRNDLIVRPAPLGTVVPHEVRAYYLGWGGDGHFGRLNISHQFYQAFGRDEFNGLAGRPVNLDAQFAALELSLDQDWLRYKASFVYASGDANSEDGTATGFDTILDNVNFVGGPFSYYLRQGFNLGGTAINFKQRDSLVPDLRSSKVHGQANFVNPGVYLWGLGLEAEITPKFRAFANANYIRMAETDPIRTALLVDKVSREIGWDLSLGIQYRPMLTDNVIINAGFGALLPGQGYRDIYRRNPNPVPGFQPSSDAGKVDGFLYSGLFALTLTY